MKSFHAAKAADRVSGSAILVAGLVGGALVFFVALPLALSSPFPKPKQTEWIVETPADPVAVAAPVPSGVSPRGDGEPPASLGAFNDRWNLTVPVPNVARSVVIPPEAARLETVDATGSIVPSKSLLAVDDAAPRRTSKQRVAALTDQIDSAAAQRARDAALVDEVSEYLWEVYQRAPVKKDGTGDFTWKDPAAAKRRGMSLQTYVIGGMDPDFKEQLYAAGHAMDDSGLKWSMLSAFRDDYRQGLAAGFKARGGNSLHGGSRRTGGYGHGRAIDITTADGDREMVWHWLDAHGAKYGLHRPMPGADPAHVQSRGAWQNLAHALRNARTKLANQMRAPSTEPADRTKVAAKGS